MEREDAFIKEVNFLKLIHSEVLEMSILKWKHFRLMLTFVIIGIKE